MNFYQLDYTVEKTLKNSPTKEQLYLKEFTGKEFPKEEAKYLWERIGDHKWYVSERLNRDIGFRVAAVDYVENFYESFFYGTNKTDFKNSFRDLFKIITKVDFLRPKSL